MDIVTISESAVEAETWAESRRTATFADMAGVMRRI
jgi:purine-nucleoside phosphorylase